MTDPIDLDALEQRYTLGTPAHRDIVALSAAIRSLRAEVDVLQREHVEQEKDKRTLTSHLETLRAARDAARAALLNLYNGDERRVAELMKAATKETA